MDEFVAFVVKFSFWVAVGLVIAVILLMVILICIIA